MPIESSYDYIDSLNPAWPLSGPSGDDYATADDHLRGIKTTLLNTLPNITGAITATQTELNLLDGALISTTEINYLQGITSAVEETNAKDTVDGYCGLDGSALIPLANIPNDLTGKTAADSLLLNGQSDYPRTGNIATITSVWTHEAIVRFGNADFIQGRDFADANWLQMIGYNTSDDLVLGQPTLVQDVLIRGTGYCLLEGLDLRMEFGEKLYLETSVPGTFIQALEFDFGTNSIHLGTTSSLNTIDSIATTLSGLLICSGTSVTINNALSVDSGNFTVNTGNSVQIDNIPLIVNDEIRVNGGPADGVRIDVNNTAADRKWLSLRDESGSVVRMDVVSPLGDDDVQFRDGDGTVTLTYDYGNYVWNFANNIQVAGTTVKRWRDLGTMDTLLTTQLGELTNIPAGCDKIELICDEVSLNGTGDDIYINIGDGTGYSTDSEGSCSGSSGTSLNNTSWSAGVGIDIDQPGSGTTHFTGIITLERLPGDHRWIVSGTLGNGIAGGTRMRLLAGYIDNVIEIDRIKVDSSGSETFDVGQIAVRAFA